MHNSCLPLATRAPILLDKGHHLATLIIMDAHRRILHNGVKETLLVGTKETVRSKTPAWHQRISYFLKGTVSCIRGLVETGGWGRVMGWGGQQLVQRSWRAGKESPFSTRVQRRFWTGCGGSSLWAFFFPAPGG